MSVHPSTPNASRSSDREKLARQCPMGSHPPRPALQDGSLLAESNLVRAGGKTHSRPAAPSLASMPTPL